jgi:glycosyltransferase involved in cell wall biosynthesis
MAMVPRKAIAASRRVAIVAADAGRLLQRRTPLLQTLAAAGHKVLCLTPSASVNDRAALASLGIATGEFPLGANRIRTLGDKPAIAKLAAHFAEWGPNVVLGFGFKPMLLAARAAQRTPAPHVVLVATSLSSFDKRPGFASRWLTQRALKQADVLVVHNQADAARLKTLDLIPPSLSVQVLPGAGVDLMHYPHVPLPALDRGFVFAMISSLERAKGIVEFCEAARRVRAKSPSARFVLATRPGTSGTTLAAKDLQSYADCVEIITAPTDVRPILAACHVFVFPSWGEGMAHEVVEALATGRPAITTTAPGCSETVDERVSGVLVPPSDTLALAAAIESFLRRPDLMAWMSQASRHKAERRFDAHGVNAGLLRLMKLEARS